MLSVWRKTFALKQHILYITQQLLNQCLCYPGGDGFGEFSWELFIEMDFGAGDQD